MTDFHSMTLDKPYSEITEQDLINHPDIRPYYLEYLLSYFFGETKLILSDTEGKIRFLELTTKPDQLSTSFNLSDIQNKSYDEFIKRFWLVVFTIGDYATKKSRP